MIICISKSQKKLLILTEYLTSRRTAIAELFLKLHVLHLAILLLGHSQTTLTSRMVFWILLVVIIRVVEGNHDTRI